MSEISVVGNVTRTELRHTQAGHAVLTFGVAINRYKGPDKDPETDFVDCVAWRDLAENANDTIEKGTRVVVVGRLQQRSWETEDGSKRSKVEIVADEIGVALRFATADVHKQSKGGGGGGTQRKSDDTWAPNDDEPFRMRRPTRGDAWL